MAVERTDLCDLSISELAPLIRAKKLSPVEVAEAAVARIAALNDRLIAFCTYDSEHVRAQARRAEAQLMQNPSFLKDYEWATVPLGAYNFNFFRRRFGQVAALGERGPGQSPRVEK